MTMPKIAIMSTIGLWEPVLKWQSNMMPHRVKMEPEMCMVNFFENPNDLAAVCL